MATTTRQVQVLADAYREAMAEGDRRLPAGSAERKILQAIVASSASDNLQWVQTRVADGNTVAKPLEELLPALQKGNVVGTGLKNAEDMLFKQAKAAVTALIGGGTAPVWLSSGAAFILGIFGFAQQAGASIGAALIPAVLGGGSILYAISRVVSASGDIARVAGGAVSSLWASASSIGSAADSIVRDKISAPMGALRGSDAPSAVSSPILAKLRGGAQTLVASAFIVLALCAIFFAAGIKHSYDAYKATTSVCSYRLPDGSCLK